MVQPLGNLFIVAAPSGAGKSSLIAALFESADKLQLVNPVQLSVSHTTRLPREGERDGVHYHFTDSSHFQEMIAQQAFYEHAQVFDNYYGTSKAAISDKLDQGVDVFLDIDWQGARQVKAQNASVISIFILPPSLAELEKRLVNRAKDSAEVIQKRMQQAMSEMSHALEFDYVLVNDDFEQCLQDFASIVKAQSFGAKKQTIRYQSLFNDLVKPE